MSCRDAWNRMFELTAGDLLPSYVADARSCSGMFSFSFVGWALTFEMRGPITVTGAATGDIDGVLTHDWVSGETDMPGDYEPLFHGISPSGKPQTFRPTGVIRIVP